MQYPRLVSSAIWRLGVAVVVLSVFACGSDTSPAGPADQPAVTQAQDGHVWLSFSAEGAARAAKGVPFGGRGRRTAANVGPDGGRLSVEDKGRRTKRDDMSVSLTIPPGALVRSERITMAVHGNKLSGLVIEFGPCGLEFLAKAKLQMMLAGGLLDLDLTALEAWHQSAGSNPEQIGIISAVMYDLKQGSYQETDRLNKVDRIRITVGIPGFSRYGMGEY
jgi:hypothetical protein